MAGYGESGTGDGIASLDDLPGRGTNRPYTGAAQPREESQRRRSRAERATDIVHQEHVRWLKEVTAMLNETSEFKDSWRNDVRWDDLPPEWEFKPWRARKIREKLLTSRRRGVR